LFAQVVRYVEPKLNRRQRSTGTRLVRGLLLVLFMALIAGGAGLVFVLVAGLVPGSWIVEVFLVAALLGQGAVFMDAIGVASTLGDGSEPQGDDPHQAARSGIEALVHGFIDHGVSPIFWFLLLGLPGMLAFRAIEVTSRLVGEWERKSLFGWAAARSYDAVNVVPTILGGLFLVAAGLFVPSAKPLRGVGVMVRRGAAFPSFSQGWAIAAMAGLLGLSLGGPRPKPDDERVFARSVQVPWIRPDDGRAMLAAPDLRRALFLFALACLLVLAVVLLAAVIRAA
jgi:adenosylcobinamide-phosphate synthase